MSAYIVHTDAAAAITKIDQTQGDPTFTIAVRAESRARTFKGAEQRFPIDFNLKITIKEFMHKFELTPIVLGGGQFLVPNMRYVFNNFNLQIIPIGAEIDCPNAKPNPKFYDHKDGVQWCYIIDNPFELREGSLRWEHEAHLAEYSWESSGCEPTGYLIRLRVGLTFAWQCRDLKNWHHDQDLVNSVSLRLQRVRGHLGSEESLRSSSCSWIVARAVDLGSNKFEEFVHSSHFKKCECCRFTAGICTVNQEQRYLTV